jgi:ankyrin repeat protein
MIASLLIRHTQADINYTQCGKTLLIAAVEKDNIEMVRILLDAGAVVDRVSNVGTALTVAMRQKNYSVEQLLREYGAA